MVKFRGATFLYIFICATLLFVLFDGHKLLEQRLHSSPALSPLVTVTAPETFTRDEYLAKNEYISDNPVSIDFLNSINAFTYTTSSTILHDAKTNICY